ncbi:High-affinity branched-chain amino acid transport system permease protein LivH [Pandoraea terrae]|uniref:High-affinity branched-chain amino acid transport system permease protein LivH n=1 Tax=Pandoraea terrae TaxID=1537710 RepID=A0A5E4SET9_9BURK|nr:branched-chain amino acid ABC transporter permease [Pandoraea terrae]VVD73681.1 High-affinity branched-chain amino acid transport system permease protein LivH [Pandoraea terrae]
MGASLDFTLGVMFANGVSYGLLLFMLSSGLTLIFSMLGVLNFAHATFYMLGAYFAYTLSAVVGFWPALVGAPLLVGLGGGVFERHVLRHLRARGALAELLATFGLAYVLVEVVQLIWGRGPVDYRVPGLFEGVLVPFFGLALPAYRVFIMALALAIAAALALGLRATRAGLVMQAALSQPAMTQALGYDVPRLYTSVFACGAGLAALAGAAGGNVLVTEPGMAATVGSVIFVVVVAGGLGSLAGAFAASILIGVLQTWAVASDANLASLIGVPEWASPSHASAPFWQLTMTQLAPVVPYLLMVVVLLVRPRGLFGVREA